ncbi:dienelactone hydrolase family protein [Sphingomonas sp. LaA6.9]|uniref:dienelactone hydrolase family protein n=1 Tax=Sphingomonas sp. LaA6.9 TaxID=2919914 RepID=UPI001F4FBC5B|nr:dienelactone hydrolase family protein [Sphingomonas sp. LaA6.9]MCJ8157190.1 dienelactone hydrolase family protein [Sphingomonas sp. LaA6.9]
MIDRSIRQQAIALYDRYTHETLDRRAFMAELTRLAGSAAAANALLLSIAADPAGAAIVPPDDKRLVVRKGPYELDDGTMTGYFAKPASPRAKLGAIMVIHENRGLNAHVEDVARRLALAGFFVVAPDFLSASGGTPADEDKAREMIGKLDYQRAIAAGVSTIRRLKSLENTNGKAGTVGFCWGGAMVNQVALAAGKQLDAGVSYYGPAPAASEAVRIQAPLLLHYAGNDARVNATGMPWTEALKKAGKAVESFTYPGVEHAFNNDTSSARYNKDAADLAWDRTLAFFKRYLAP